MKTRKPMKFETVPTWAIEAGTVTRYTIAAAFTLAGLTEQWIRLTAQNQRDVFGCVLFGKCEIKVGNDGIRASRSACFGTDFSSMTLDWVAVEKYVASGCRPTF